MHTPDAPTASASTVSFVYPNIVDNNSNLKAAAGTVKFPVSTNGSCDFQLTATNGTLNGGTTTPIAYKAGIAAGAAAAALSAEVDGTSLTTTALTVNAGSEIVGGANTDATVWFAYNIAADNHTTYLPGTYTETLHVILTPHT